MRSWLRIGLAGWGFFVFAAFARMAETATATAAHPLAWDAMEKTYDAKPGDEVAEFSFTAKNKGDKAVEILELKPSCGCTVAEMPATPWLLAPGASGTFRATADFKGKVGKFTKSIYVVSSAGTQMLTVHVNIPDTEEARRARNQQLAAVDRQAVFRGECATCHVAPTQGKKGGELFAAACGICHTAAHRAELVPDLAMAREPRDAAYWEKWIAEGKAQTLMPAFAQARGGPLNEEQIRSLVEFALKSFPTQPSRR